MKQLKPKNIIISILIILTFIQTAKLWFVNYPSHSFFDFNSATPTIDYDVKEVFSTLNTPYRMILGLGKDKTNFVVTYNDFSVMDTNLNIDLILVDFFESGQFVDSEPINWNLILENKLALYEYAFNMPSNSFTNSFDVKSNLLSNKTKYFNSIVVIPQSTEHSGVSILFLDTVNNMSFKYKLPKNYLVNELSTSIESDYLQHSDLYYTSTILSGYSSVFNGNIFLPYWDKTSFYYKSIVSANPYLENGEGANMTRISNKIDFLFDNQSGKIPNYPNNNIFSFSSGNIVVNYNTETEVLEYNNYKTTNNNKLSTFDNSYISAKSFINQDTNITNEYYLSAVENNGNKYIFYFDYVINDLPMFMSENNSSGLKNPIIITVTNNIVTNYKFFARNFTTNEDLTLTVKNNYIEALDKIDINSSINNLKFFYNIDNNEIYKLYWLIDADSSAPITLSAN